MNLRQTRKKIKSVGNVKKITKAMQMIAAIKMKKSQTAAIEGRPYDEELKKIISRVIPMVNEKYSPLLVKQEEAENKKKLAIVIASNKGLCGGFNINLFRFVSKNVDFKQTDLVIIGKKATFLSRLGANISADFSSPNNLNNISAVFNFASEKFLKGDYQEIILFFNKFISVLRVEPVKVLILPVKLDLTKEEPLIKTRASDYLIEPTPETIIDPLLKSYVQELIKNAIIESEASEHSSRMIAMKNATDNASDVIYNLTMLRNKIRQENITNELLDMVSAKASVEGN
ncbi:MAG: ATP synthase F1, gamma subunit [Candidatus Roizmanbacteria bacterium GW2011_GWC2_37_13]|uniref:ATP synthase gamma chain n=1 Tax=Candidatus Roizmanbacteria bacterium GW2011_GWC2_37_13 TaxID=1618486 RepID=A0A0G0JA48_9BACT|nr:MAG: ATP synthase F1, gamma subunit [Candidatus Roizmanbacteria bacterium GW2011_GWC1_37_12]KKQ25071.1 MAG: ATP synthase F1, gamma subunit [Candidatus Roizmanbacteria bacterium GW2011_GWC2_37_13]